MHASPRAHLLMMWTLYAYILRDLLKTFLLTIVAIAVIITMGGGVYQIIRFEGVSTGDVLGVVPLFIPIVVTIAMPVAGLFAASIVYGRLSADNELQACRAAGIHIYRLFVPIILMALAVAMLTTVSGSYVIPRCVKEMVRIGNMNVRDMVSNQLQKRGYARFKESIFITAAGSSKPSDEELRKANHPLDGYSYLYVQSPTILQLKDGRTQMFATARGGLAQFNTRATPLEISLIAEDGRVLRPPESAVEFELQSLGPIVVPFLTLPDKPGWADLSTLLHWRAEPWQWSDLAGKIDRFRKVLAAYVLHTTLGTRLGAGEKVELSDENVTYFVSAKTAVGDRRDVSASDVRVEQRVRGTLRTMYEAQQAKIVARPARENILLDIRLLPTTAKPVTETSAGHGGRSSRHEKPLNLPSVFVPTPEIVQSIRPDQVLNPAFSIENLPQELASDRKSVQREAAVFSRKVTAEIHMRLVLTTANLVTLILAAALGVMFRGARALAAFALAMIPLAFVILITMMGKRIAENENATYLGPYVMWSGMAACAIADMIVLRLGIRR